MRRRDAVVVGIAENGLAGHLQQVRGRVAARSVLRLRRGVILVDGAEVDVGSEVAAHGFRIARPRICAELRPTNHALPKVADEHVRGVGRPLPGAVADNEFRDRETSYVGEE